MSDVPDEMIREMLSRVPAEPLLRFRCVSKEWRLIIDDPFFTQLHFDQKMGGDSLFIRTTSGKLYSVPLGSLNFSKSSSRVIVATNIKNVIRRGIPRIVTLPVPSCNGLVLISDLVGKKVWGLWNPFNGKWVELLPYDFASSTKREKMVCCGLGFDAATSDYKVVRIARLMVSRPNRQYMLKTSIYSTKLATWRRVEDFPSCNGRRRVISPGVFVSNALHWITTAKDQGYNVECIVVLDFVTEMYRELPLPTASSEGKPYLAKSKKHLDALEGNLFLSCSATGMIDTFGCEIDYFSLWIWQECGEVYKWTEVISLSRNDIGARWNLRPVAYMMHKHQVLVQYNDDKFMWFDVEKNKCTSKVTVQGIEGGFSSQVLPASLIWLNGSSDADKSIASKGTTERKRKRTNNRLELKLSSWCDPLQSWFSWPGL